MKLYLSYGLSLNYIFVYRALSSQANKHIFFKFFPFLFRAQKFNTKCNSRFVFAALVCFVTNLLGSTFAAFAVGSGLEKCFIAM